MKQKVGRLKKKLTTSNDIRNLVWLAVFLIIICSLASALLVNFFNNLYYSRQLLQANSQSAIAQTRLGKYRYDVKFLIDNSSNQFNCYDLHSNYTRSICFQHQKTISMAGL